MGKKLEICQFPFYLLDYSSKGVLLECSEQTLIRRVDCTRISNLFSKKAQIGVSIVNKFNFNIAACSSHEGCTPRFLNRKSFGGFASDCVGDRLVVFDERAVTLNHKRAGRTAASFVQPSCELVYALQRSLRMVFA